jgi:hypothetical protein
MIDTKMIERADGTREWRRDGQLHRADGPAVEWDDGTCEWWRNGKRMSGPAHAGGKEAK